MRQQLHVWLVDRSAQQLLRERGPVVGQALLAGENPDAAVEAERAEGLRGADSGEAAAHDHDSRAHPVAIESVGQS